MSPVCKFSAGTLQQGWVEAIYKARIASRCGVRTVQYLDYAKGHLSVSSEDPDSGNWQAVQAVSMRSV